ncbi:MAG: class I SAM-dependent methyltransferase [Syntrophomonadaceae bacterium]|nr:class I SAM-dependent methyltransferase [Syntrophomonadaceae bacterium]
MNALRNATHLSHMLISRQVKQGDTVIDATCGNGKDTLFLARLVGCSGRIMAFDIQQQALESTRALLNEEGCEEQLSLIHDNHANIKSYIQSGVSAGMFNLGYLPGGDHTTKTNPRDTVLAVNCLLEILNPGGVVTVVSYPGHTGGLEEYAALESSLMNLPQKCFEVLTANFINQANHPSQLLYITKLS